MTTWIGAPAAPGRAGSEKTKICPPAITLHFACSSCCSWAADLLRWSQGLNSMPPKPWPGVMIWNSISYSGSRRPMANICCERSEEHTSELQSRSDLVCRLLLEKKKKKKITVNQSILNRDLVLSGETIPLIAGPLPDHRNVNLERYVRGQTFSVKNEVCERFPHSVLRLHTQYGTVSSTHVSTPPSHASPLSLFCGYADVANIPYSTFRFSSDCPCAV